MDLIFLNTRGHVARQLAKPWQLFCAPLVGGSSSFQPRAWSR